MIDILTEASADLGEWVLTLGLMHAADCPGREVRVGDVAVCESRTE
jgi:hypothetical protein